MNRIAVVFRGHMRTFRYTKEVIFDFFNAIAENVDYYFVTWDVLGLNTVPIDMHFEGKNLIALVKVPATPVFYNSWVGPGWLSYNLVPYKRQREKQVSYDAVFDTRPDVVYRLTGKSIIPPEPDTFYTTMFTNLPSDTDPSNNYIGLADHFNVMTSDVYDRLSYRYIVKNTLGCHAQLKQICVDENINTCGIDWAQAEITRPNALYRIPNPKDYFDEHKTGVSWPKIQLEWANMNSLKKLDCLKTYGINPEDYASSHSIAKL